MKSILILSKLPKNIELISEIFKKEGFSSLSATSYEELDKFLLDASFDLALLDIAGFDNKIFSYCEKLNKLGKAFFIISPFKNPKIDNEGVKKGAKGVLVKPLVIKELTELIKAMLQ